MHTHSPTPHPKHLTVWGGVGIWGWVGGGHSIPIRQHMEMELVFAHACANGALTHTHFPPTPPPAIFGCVGRGRDLGLGGRGESHTIQTGQHVDTHTPLHAPCTPLAHSPRLGPPHRTVIAHSNTANHSYPHLPNPNALRDPCTPLHARCTPVAHSPPEESPHGAAIAHSNTANHSYPLLPTPQCPQRPLHAPCTPVSHPLHTHLNQDLPIEQS